MLGKPDGSIQRNGQHWAKGKERKKKKKRKKKNKNKTQHNTTQHTKNSEDELHRPHKKIAFMRSSYNFYGLDSCKVKHLCVSNLGVCVSFHIMTGAFLLHPRWISYMTSGSSLVRSI